MHPPHDRQPKYTCLYENRIAYNSPYVFNKRLHSNWQQINSDITLHMLEVQDKVTNILHMIKHQSTIDRYMNDLKICMGDNTEKSSSWLLLVEKVLPLTNSDHKKICF